MGTEWMEEGDDDPFCSHISSAPFHLTGNTCGGGRKKKVVRMAVGIGARRRGEDDHRYGKKLPMERVAEKSSFSFFPLSLEI